MITKTLHSREDLDEMLMILRERVEVSPVVVTVKKKVHQRTVTQNSSLHKYFSIMAEKLNDAGITQKQLVGSFKEGFELSVTSNMLKDIFREVGKAMFKRESTTGLTTTEVQKVYEVVDQRLGEVTGCRCEWPSSNPPAYDGV